MRGAKTRLERLVKTVEGKKGVELSRHNFFKYFRDKGKIRNGTKIIKVSGIRTRFFQNRGDRCSFEK